MQVFDINGFQVKLLKRRGRYSDNVAYRVSTVFKGERICAYFEFPEEKPLSFEPMFFASVAHVFSDLSKAMLKST